MIAKSGVIHKFVFVVVAKSPAQTLKAFEREMEAAQPDMETKEALYKDVINKAGRLLAKKACFLPDGELESVVERGQIELWERE